MSTAANFALRGMARALDILKADIRISGLHQRQLTPIARIRDQLDTIVWLIDYDVSRVDIPQNDSANFDRNALPDAVRYYAERARLRT